MRSLLATLRRAQDQSGVEVISEDVRVRLAHTIAAVERQRHSLAAQLAERMEPDEPPEESAPPETVARLMVEALIDGGSDIAAFGGLRNLAPVRDRHLELGIDGRHYSRLGVALDPALQAVFGIAMPPPALSAWGEAYWLVVGGLNQADRPPAAGPVPVPRPEG